MDIKKCSKRNMKKNSRVSKVSSVLVPVFIIYSILGLFLLKYLQYQINPDGISYISIAQKYLNGDFHNAINGFWGPLFSWLLAPFLLFGLPPLLTVKLLFLIVGLLTIVGVRLLSYRFEMSEAIRSVVLFSLIPVILLFSLYIITPDLLLVCFLVYYLNIIFDADYPARGYKGVFCGVLGATAYLTKSYAFPFFIIHFLLFNAFHYFSSVTKERKKNVLLNFLFGFVMFFVISGSWIYVISSKYNRITFGTAGECNFRCIAPGVKSRHYGFLKPPNETAVSVWEDPTYIEMASWSPIRSWDSFKYELRTIRKNIDATVYIYHKFSPLAIAIIVAYIVLCIRPLNELVSQRNTFYPLVTVVIYPAGYILLLVAPRYLWINCVLLMLMGGHLLNILFRKGFFNNLGKKIVLMFFALSFVVAPLLGLDRKINIGREGKDIYNLSKTLENQYGIQGNIASNKEWHKSLYLSYHLNCKYYGTPVENITGKDLQAELRKNNIDYYFVWDESEGDSQTFSSHVEITGGGIPSLRIYSLKENK